MHDSVIAQSILRDLKKYGDVKKAELEIGELFGIESDHLLEHLKEVSSIIFSAVRTPSDVSCSCGYNGRAKIIERLHDMVLFECPRCGEAPEVLSGDKIVIKKVET
ncbi:MAG: hydrogenase/urease maturation nickel metallochaperone HypA [archaeon]